MKKVNSKSGSFGKAIGAILLALVFAVGGAVAGWYAHAQNWFGIGEKTDEQTKDEANGMIVSGIEAHGLEVAVSPLAATTVGDGQVVTDEAYTLTVTPDPVDADDTYTWTATDTSSVTLSPSGDTKSCTVTCNQAFGTQITLTVTSTVTPEVTASATLDYLKAPTNVTVTSPTTIAFSTSGTTYTVSATPTWGTGTLTPDTFTVTGGTLENNRAGSCSGNVTGSPTSLPNGTTQLSKITCTYKDHSFEGTELVLGTPADVFIATQKMTTDTIGGPIGMSKKYMSAISPLAAGGVSNAQSDEAYNNSFKSAVTGANDGTLTVDYTYSYQGVQIASSSVEISVGFDVSAMSVNAVTIDPNADSVIFY